MPSTGNTGELSSELLFWFYILFRARKSVWWSDYKLNKGKAKQNYLIFISILWLSYHKCNGWQRERNIIIIIFIEIASIFWTRWRPSRWNAAWTRASSWMGWSTPAPCLGRVRLGTFHPSSCSRVNKSLDYSRTV